MNRPLFIILSSVMFCTTVCAQNNEGATKNKYSSDRSAEFPGGQDQLTKYLQKNFKCKSGNNGKVFVAFAIDSSGDVKRGSVYFVKSRAEGVMSDECKHRLVEILENSPKWTPGFSFKTNRKVTSNMIVPVKFK